MGPESYQDFGMGGSYDHANRFRLLDYSVGPVVDIVGGKGKPAGRAGGSRQPVRCIARIDVRFHNQEYGLRREDRFVL